MGKQRSERAHTECRDGSKIVRRKPPYETGETELRELFGQFGSVDTVRIMRDMATGRARGFGFVEMTTDRWWAAHAVFITEHVVTRRCHGSTGRAFPGRSRVGRADQPRLDRRLPASERGVQLLSLTDPRFAFRPISPCLTVPSGSA